MFLKKNWHKLGLILLLTSLYPSISQAYIYGYKGGIRNNMVIGGQGAFAFVDIDDSRLDYKRMNGTGGIGNINAGVETQFNKYFSLISTIGIDFGSFLALDGKITPRVYLGIPYLFVELGLGLSTGVLSYSATNQPKHSHDDSQDHHVITDILYFMDIAPTIGISIPFNPEFSFEILVGIEGKPSFEEGFDTALTSPISVKVNLNFTL